MIFGEGSHGAGGERGSDLERATTLAAAMAGSVGLAGHSPLLFLGPSRDAHSFIAFEEVRESVDAELRKAAASCRELLERHRGAVEMVARRLSTANRVDGTEVARILEREASSDANGGAEPAQTLAGAAPNKR
jgi:ATP-dependent Zn protease